MSRFFFVSLAGMRLLCLFCVFVVSVVGVALLHNSISCRRHTDTCLAMNHSKDSLY